MGCFGPGLDSESLVSEEDDEDELDDESVSVDEEDVSVKLFRDGATGHDREKRFDEYEK